MNLFEQRPIQHIIDYKWDTYTYNFFLNKFYIYFIFLLFYFIDIQRGLESTHTGLRVKDTIFYVNKGVCIVVQMTFTIYECV